MPVGRALTIAAIITLAPYHVHIAGQESAGTTACSVEALQKQAPRDTMGSLKRS